MFRHDNKTNERHSFFVPSLVCFFAPILRSVRAASDLSQHHIPFLPRKEPRPLPHKKNYVVSGRGELVVRTVQGRGAVGWRVGKLTVIAATEQRKNSYTVWRCRCDCGGEILLDTRTLQRGTVTDCGCKTKLKPGQRDITGQRFGLLTAVRPVGLMPGKRGVIWHCVCDCGGEVDAPLPQLTAGYRKSCGCLSHPPMKDYIGKRFSMLTVVAYAGKEDGQHLWRCKCDCGNEAVVRQTNLQSGKTKSCGCLQEKQILENLKLCDGTSVAILEAVRSRLLPTNTSGVTGVYQNKRTGKWCAQITFKRKTYFLGAYEKKEDAVKARKRGEELHEDFLAQYYAAHKQAEGEALSV